MKLPVLDPAEQLVKEAWVGDAVLSLYARCKILNETGRADGVLFVRLTSNQFLACFGEPTKVEASIGRIYAEEGLQRAFQWIEETLIPLFERQEEKRARKSSKR